MSSFGGHCAFIVAVHVAQRQRQVRIEFVFVREWELERERIQANKRKGRNQTNGVQKEEDLFSLVHQPNPFLATPYSSTRIILCLVLFFFFSNPKNESTPFIIIKYESRSTVERAHTHTTEFLVVVVVVASCRFPVWKRTTDKRVGSWEKEWLYDDDERLCHEKPDRFLKVDVIIIPYWTMRHTSNVLPWRIHHHPPILNSNDHFVNDRLWIYEKKNGEKKIWKRKSVGFRQKEKVIDNVCR